MTNQIKTYLELLEFIPTNRKLNVLEVGGIKESLAPLIQQPMDSSLSIDLFTLDKEEYNQSVQSSYRHIYVSPEWNQQQPDDSYDIVVIPQLFNTLDKQQALNLLNDLLKIANDYVLILLTGEESIEKWPIPEFSRYDLSFFRLTQANQTVLKFYKKDQSIQIRECKWIEENQKKSLNILYVMPHQNLTGGLKMLYEQMKSLQRRGHMIQVLIRGDYQQAVPQWVENFTPDQDIVIKIYEKYIDYLQNIDVVFAGFYNQIPELENSKVPVLYWEQGHEYLYGDVGTQQLEPVIRESMYQGFNRDIYFATDSKYVHEIVRSRFNKDSYILPIFIDTDFYYPLAQKENRELVTILLVGNPGLTFKGFQKALMVLLKIWADGSRFKVSWACQFKPQLSPLPFEITFYENVPQTQLAEIYRNADILLSCSVYEGCPMPPLEAMASGVAVVTTNSGGINQYAVHGQNAFIAKTNKVNELSKLVEELIIDQEKRRFMIQNGIKTAHEYNYENKTQVLEHILCSVVADFNEKLESRIPERSRIKVLFLIGTLLGGGSERVLCNVVKYLNPELFEITVQTVFNQGVYIEEIKKYATYKTIYQTTASTEEEASQLIAYYEYLNKLSEEEFSHSVIDDHYDIEVAFLEDQSTRIIANSSNHKAKKIAWVHADLIQEPGSLQFYRDIEHQKACYQKFDDIVFVSKTAKEAFNQKFQLHLNQHVIYNPIDRDEIIKLSKESLDKELINDRFKVIFVGRLIPAKGLDRLLLAHYQLIKEGFDYELWILGDGVLKESINQFIAEHGLLPVTKCLGFDANPYKYIANSDLFICSSQTEGFSLVIAEALALGIPVISTDCAGPLELIGDSQYGLVVENSAAGVYEGMKSLLTHTTEYQKFSKRSKNRGIDFDISSTISQIEQLLLGSSLHKEDEDESL